MRLALRLREPYHGDQGTEISVVCGLRFACVSLATLIMTVDQRANARCACPFLL
jgi:hypothetical protein